VAYFYLVLTVKLIAVVWLLVETFVFTVKVAALLASQVIILIALLAQQVYFYILEFAILIVQLDYMLMGLLALAYLAWLLVLHVLRIIHAFLA